MLAGNCLIRSCNSGNTVCALFPAAHCWWAVLHWRDVPSILPVKLTGCSAGLRKLWCEASMMASFKKSWLQAFPLGLQDRLLTHNPSQVVTNHRGFHTCGYHCLLGWSLCDSSFQSFCFLSENLNVSSNLLVQELD